MTSIEVKRPSGSAKTSVLLVLAISVLFICYAIQIVSPLRLGPDEVTLLDLTSKLTDGQPYLENGVRPIFPIGVPFLFSLMERAGGANAFGFGFLNLVCLCVAGYASWLICESFAISPSARSAIILISFSNFVLFKHSVLPLTDLPYMAVSLVAIALLEMLARQNGWRKTGTFSFALLCVVGGILTRRVGVALIPAILYALWLALRMTTLPRRLQFAGEANRVPYSTALRFSRLSPAY
jgi:hypothetical protein